MDDNGKRGRGDEKGSPVSAHALVLAYTPPEKKKVNGDEDRLAAGRAIPDPAIPLSAASFPGILPIFPNLPNMKDPADSLYQERGKR